MANQSHPGFDMRIIDSKMVLKLAPVTELCCRLLTVLVQPVRFSPAPLIFEF